MKKNSNVKNKIKKIKRYPLCFIVSFLGEMQCIKSYINNIL